MSDHSRILYDVSTLTGPDIYFFKEGNHLTEGSSFFTENNAEPGDYDTEVALIAAQSQESPRKVRARLEKRGQMDALRNQIVERKVIALITSHAEFNDVPFQPQKDETAAIDRSVTGHEGEVEIPDAKYAGETEELPGEKPRA